MKDRIDGVIENFMASPRLIKYQAILKAEAYQEVLKEHKEIRCLSDNPYNSYVFGIIDYIAIVGNHTDPIFPDAPFTYCLRDSDGSWKGSKPYYPSIETALLAAIAEKHLCRESEFAFFASKMLGLGE